MWRADKEGSRSGFSVVNVSDHATRSAARGAEGCEACRSYALWQLIDKKRTGAGR